MQVLLDKVVLTDYGQLTLQWGPDTWDGDDDRFFAGEVNGWVGAAVPDSVYLVLGRRSGGSAIRIELRHAGPGVSARGRDAGRAGEFDDAVMDRHLLQAWPADPAPDAVLRSTSSDADLWNTTWGDRRDH